MGPADRERIRSLAIEATRSDFATFVARAFAYLHPGETFVAGREVLAMCHALEEVRLGHERFLLVNAPPRSLKSFIVSISYPAWDLGHDPMQRIICASYAAELADSFAYATRRIMEAPWYKSAFPKTRLDPKRTNASELRTTKGGYRMARSLNGSLTGFGGDKMILDEALNAGLAGSETERRSANDKYANVLPTRLNNPKTGAIIVTAQRLHTDDLSARLIAEGGWRHLNLPMTAPRDEDVPIGPGRVWHRRAGSLLQPERFGPEEIERIRRQIGEAQYQAQYEQKPEAPEGAMFKLAQFGRHPRKGFKRGQFEQIVISWDMAMSASATANYSAFTAWGIAGPEIHLMGAARKRLGYTELLAWVIDRQEHCRKLVPQPVTIIENKALGTPIIEDLARANYNWFFAMPTDRDKVTRAAQQSAKIESGRVFLPSNHETMPWLEAFEDEVARFPHGPTDDWVDTMTHALRFIDEAWDHPLMRDLSIHEDKRPRAELIPRQRRLHLRNY